MPTQIHFQKFKNLVTKNCMLTSKSLHKIIPKLCDWLTFSFAYHQNSTRPAKNGCTNIPSHRSKSFGRYSVTINPIYS